MTKHSYNIVLVVVKDALIIKEVDGMYYSDSGNMEWVAYYKDIPRRIFPKSLSRSVILSSIWHVIFCDYFGCLRE